MLLLQIYYQNLPATGVPEYSEIEIRLTNQTQATLKNLKVYLQNYHIRKIATLAPNSSYSFSYNVRDYVGELQFWAYYGEHNTKTGLQVEPQKLTQAELYFIKFNRLPAVLSRLNAPNGIRLRYDDPPLQPYFDFFSAEYTAEKLLFFSRQFLEEGLAERILENLDYTTPEQIENRAGEIRGAINWQTTLREWFNHPEQTHIYHHWKTVPKIYTTLPNFLFVFFQQELAKNLADLARWAQKSEVSKPLKILIKDFDRRIQHHNDLLDIPEFNHIPKFNSLYTDQFQTKEAHETARYAVQDCLNPNYYKVWELWEQYKDRFVQPPLLENEQYSGLQPMSKIYELWAVCEVAAGLGLEHVPTPRKNLKVLASADFRGVLEGKPLRLAYNQGVQEGWYSATRSGTPRPDILLECGDKRLLLDVKYRLDATGRANTEDVYKMLAYMNDLGITAGGIIFPADTTTRITTDRNGQILAEIALRPPISQPENFSVTMRNLILSLL
jgi:hypothetical protein